MSRLLTIARLTLHEAARKRILLAAGLLGLAFLALYAIGFHFIFKGASESPNPLMRSIQLNIFTIVGLYAVNFLGLMSAVLLPLDTLSGEIGSGVMQTMAARPVRRSEIVLGKWLAYCGVVLAYVFLLACGVLLVARVIGHHTPPNVAIGLPCIALECMLLVTLSIWGGVRFTTVTNGVVAFGMYGIAFIGGWVEQVGAMTHNAAAQNVGTIASLIMPTESMWQLAAFHMQPRTALELHISPFSAGAQPSPVMVAWAIGWGIAVLLGALATFRKRPL
jgi:Cu-processing system permease protein